MFEISEQLILEQSAEIFGVNTTNWFDSSWKHLSLVGDEESRQSLARKGLCIFGFCVMSWKDESEPNIKYCLGATVGLVERFTTIQKLRTQSTENQWNSSGIFSQDSLHCSLSTKSKSS